MTYGQVANWATNLPAQFLRAVVLSSPFRAFDRSLTALDGPVFDFTDTGSRFQRGGSTTYLGGASGLKELSEILSRRGVGLYARLNLFQQAEGYNRGTWSGEDFIPEVLKSGGRYILDIRNASTRGKLQGIIGNIRRLPVQKWVADLRDIPETYRMDYARFLAGNFGSAVILVSTDDKSLSEFARLETQRTLANGVFSLIDPDFSALEKVRYQNGIHYLETDGAWVNHSAAVLFLTLKGQDVIVPARMLNEFHVKLLEFARTLRGGKQTVLSKDRMLIATPDALIAINFTDVFGVWTVPGLFTRQGLYKAVGSSSVLTVDTRTMNLFLFPKSIAFWRITANR